MSSLGLGMVSWLSEGEDSEPLYKRKFGMSEQKYKELIDLLRTDATYNEEECETILRAIGALCEIAPQIQKRFDAEQGTLTVKFKSRDTTREGKSPDREQDKTQDEKAEAPTFRTARPNESTVSMEVKVLEPVRKAGKELAAAHGMTAQQYMEHLLVDSLNENPRLLDKGRQRLREFKGSTAAARRFAEREELARLRDLVHSPRR